MDGETARPQEPRLDVTHVAPKRDVPTLIDDARAGLLADPRTLPPKYFYDDLGARLYEDICATADYYPARTEESLLVAHSADILARTDPDHIVELGSGSSRKTRHLLDAAGNRPRTYWPFDVSETMLVESARELVAQYPNLHVHALVGDYGAGLDLPVPASGSRLVAFLGGTIGNFTPDAARAFLRELRDSLQPGDWLLLGADRVKDIDTLIRAYDDADGATAAFNRNVLRVLNRELGADFDVDAFQHIARFNTERQAVEMHLCAAHDQTVQLPALDTQTVIRAGETIRTELSHKFSEVRLRELLDATGFETQVLYTAPEPLTFSLALARVAG